MARPSPGAERAVSHQPGYPGSHVRKPRCPARTHPAVARDRPLGPVDEHDLALRRALFASFAATGGPPDEPGDLRSLAEQHVVALDAAGRVLMAHPFAAHHDGARVEAPDGRVWWGNCAWDGLGIVTALGLRAATVTAQGISVSVADGAVHGDAVFQVAVPAAHWWDDVAYT